MDNPAGPLSCRPQHARHTSSSTRPPSIFADTLAQAFLGERAEELLGYHRSYGGHPVLSGARATAVTRSRYTEDRLAEPASRGVDQYVILGAGLDSFAYGSELADGMRVFEVDKPTTQHWKRALLVETGTTVPPSAFFVPGRLREGVRPVTCRSPRAGRL
ncbi:class I SAM-dependent methyltransferase [Streptomyces sp. CB01580]|uniref:class I SAM-dependent methyltransferase n=1 Tax=Streptomyces sp. CB01580 TaxID=1703933 RepID=UPI000AD36D63|nr:class I SAM-dependent methyltransferase [Streptomyces sp. CB01580]